MPKQVTLETLQRLSAEERHTLWQRARERAANSEDAKAVLNLIENSGLDYKKDKRASVALDSPLGIGMRGVILSKAGIDAALAAVGAGLPALAGVDPLLREKFGDEYTKNNEATVQAGYLVTGMMEGQGYEKIGSGPMPSGCTAKTGQLFKRKNQ